MRDRSQRRRPTRAAAKAKSSTASSRRALAQELDASVVQASDDDDEDDLSLGDAADEEIDADPVVGEVSGSEDSDSDASAGSIADFIVDDRHAHDAAEAGEEVDTQNNPSGTSSHGVPAVVDLVSAAGIAASAKRPSPGKSGSAKQKKAKKQASATYGPSVHIRPGSVLIRLRVSVRPQYSSLVLSCTRRSLSTPRVVDRRQRSALRGHREASH